MSKRPPVINVDDLQYMKQDALERLVNNLEEERNKLILRLKDKNADLQFLRDEIREYEDGICYVLRELDIRKARKLAHEIYLTKAKK
jgi:Holliday junction resolvase